MLLGVADDASVVCVSSLLHYILTIPDAIAIYIALCLTVRQTIQDTATHAQTASHLFTRKSFCRRHTLDRRCHFKISPPTTLWRRKYRTQHLTILRSKKRQEENVRLSREKEHVNNDTQQHFVRMAKANRKPEIQLN